MRISNFSLARATRAAAFFALALSMWTLLPGGAFAQQAPNPPPAAITVALPQTLPTVFNGDLRYLPPTYTPRPYLMLNEGEPPPVSIPPQTPGSLPSQPSIRMLAPMPSPSANFAGLGYSDSVNGGQAGGGWPPDTNGDVGPTYYIQSVNTAIGIFNKTTGVEATAFTINQLWSVSGTSTPCLTENDGDPVVLHDARSDHWVITDFAFGVSGGNPTTPFYECIAVSQTGDPVGGGWYFYAVRMDTGGSGPPTDTLNDYPKFGLWNDGCLYMGANGFTYPTGNYTGSIFASFSTTDMYAGNALTSSVGWLAWNSATGQEFALFPADLLGRSADSLPPSGTSEYFASQNFAFYRFDVRKFTPGTNCGAGGTLSAATQVSQTSGYTINQGHNIPQPGTTDVLDTLGFRLMQRVQYRKIGNAESLWVVHTTGNPTQPQWSQINVSGGTIHTTPVQQQIYAPDATEYRWMPSLAVDGLGDMALGYSRSSGTAGDYPSLYYAGRLAADAANSLPQSEVALVTGGGSQTNNCGGAACYRWGDYSSMTIDPNDDCTFWYTNEYYVNQTQGTAGNWQTRIGAFKFPGCNSYTLTYTTDGNGAISGSTPQTVITGGSGTAVTAAPNLNYHFVQWSDASIANPRTDTNVTANISVQAQFTLNTYTLTYTTDGNGTITSGNATQSGVPFGSSGTAVTVVPNAGYHFVQWSDASTANPRTDTNVQADLTVQAQFAANVLVFTTQPVDVSQGGSQGTIAVTEQDGSGNTVSDTATVDFTIAACGGPIDLGSVAMVSGVATLTSAQRYYTLASSLTVNAAVTNPNPTPIAAVASGTFNVTANTDLMFSDGFDGCRL